MVYRGKPSKGCFLCRRRRIKCDQRRPGCTQCSNVGVPCAGYRKAEDLMFLDETATTTQKYLTHCKSLRPDEVHAEDGSRPSSSSSSSVANERPNSASSDQSCQLFLPSSPIIAVQAPSIRVEDLAVTFFLGTYVYNSRFDYVPGMYSSCAQRQSPLVASVSACALASLSFELESSKIAAVARRRYARALSLTNKALTRPHEAVRDDTLAAVLVLSLFETITQADELSQASWEAHVNGAAMLLRMRGQGQFHSFLGRTLYLHAADSIRISCFQNAHAVPKELQAMDAIAAVKAESLIVQLHTIITNLAELRSSMHRSSSSGEDAWDSTTLIARYRAFEAQVLAVTYRHPALLAYSEHHVDAGTPGVFEGMYHIYGDRTSLRVSNVLQMMLVWLNEQIYLASFDCEERARAAAAARAAATHICASVPQQMGDVPAPISAALVLSSRIVLIWPLSVLGERVCLPAAVKHYAIAQLRRIGAHNKIPQATLTAEALAGARTKRLWVHMYHIT